MLGNCGPRYSLRWRWSDVYLRRFWVWCINKRRILCTTPVCITDDIRAWILSSFTVLNPAVHVSQKKVLFVPACCFKHLKRKQTQYKDGQTKNSAAGIGLCITKIYIVYLHWSLFHVLYRCYCIVLSFKLTYYLQILRDRAERYIELNYELSVGEQCSR